MTQPFRAAPHLDRLKDFQRRTVRHVVQRMYDDPDPTRRFLVADETGLGKSVVARGVIAEALERLLPDDTVDRVDIVYVCSNADIAAQNLSRLNVVGNNRVEFKTRLTMLATQVHDLDKASELFDKPVNLIGFTPATSFEKGWRTGKAEERALLAVLLERSLGLRGRELTALHRALQGAVRTLDGFRGVVAPVAGMELDRTITDKFDRDLRSLGLEAQVQQLIADIGARRSLDDELLERSRALTGRLRTALAGASVHALGPDLVILDEFQRFRHLLDPDTGGEAAELAHHLFEWGEARTLLLSATPYKPFTLAEEPEDHYQDLMTTLSFLSSRDEKWLTHVSEAFAEYRDLLLQGRDCSTVASRLRELLLLFLCRTERPAVDGAHREVSTPASGVTARDLVDFVGLRELGRAVNSPVQVEYWKSAPYFANFLEGYQVGDRLRESLRAGGDEAVSRALTRVARLDPWAIEAFGAVDPGNARLRQLVGRTVDDGWWQLLWVPPSMPYVRPDGPYAEPFAQDVTKQLVFSSWSATPTAVASLLSYAASRHLAAGSDRQSLNTAAARRRLSTLLSYRAENDRPAAMSTLALFWPHPQLAELTDPLAAARLDPAQPLSARRSADWALAQLGDGAAPSTQTNTDFFAWPGLLPEELRSWTVAALSRALEGSTSAADDSEETSRLDLHVAEALRSPSERRPSDDLAELAMYSPGNSAWRAVGRIVTAEDDVSPTGQWRAAAVLATGLRSLFARWESTSLLTQRFEDIPYWQAVIAYCREGNLQAVLDEYLHLLRSGSGDESLNDDALVALAAAAAAPLSMRPSRYVAFDPDDVSAGIPFPSRFALRYGSRAQTEDVRMPEVRGAFNSPFWPFVLTSTSVGQEGIDFHWWCHSVVHWNTPASPVDFEQREGRVNRFGGHAVRRNLAEAHRVDVMSSLGSDPWKEAYDSAEQVRPELGDFCPFWVYPGRHAVERHLMPYPLSKDGPRAENLKRDLANYRLALGQPRQEDLLALLRTSRTEVADPIDLRPPESATFS